ncbi:hypothetical protein FOZ60_001151 [Perkinsus olseni]|uniref:Uncharacterized protein n=1 Tax=Perkinsus olseni TaxID=32597 RepID=A0A7J6P1Z2_PEROL|nr:hypothetical protein FOZ60_001151 [Perkinsus olseni]
MEIHVSRFPEYTLMEAETNRATGVRVRVQYFSYENGNWRFIFQPDYDDSGLGSELNEQGSADRMKMLFNHVNPFDEILPWIAKHVLVRHKVSGEICNLIADFIEANARPGFDDHQSDESWIYFFLLSVKDEIYDLIIEYLA